MTTVAAGSTIGVLGSGQLGRMFAIAARRMGYRVHVFSADADTPAGQVADRETRASYDDADAVADFARGVDVATFEFENIPTSTIEIVQRFVPVRPGAHVLNVTQNRVCERAFLSEAGLPIPGCRPIRMEADMDALPRFPAVLKTATCGYDGKGQARVESAADVRRVWEAWGCVACILEEFVDFECELSVVGARGADGAFACYAPIRNHHRNHILDLSMCPAGLPQRINDEATEIAREVLTRLDVIGVLCVEFFMRDGQLLINELAPRPHNSGHLTIDAHVTSQFEQQVRAVCQLPLGSTRQSQPAAMANILGQGWGDPTRDWRHEVAQMGAVLHWYGKRQAVPGRKMGHVTALADTPEMAIERARSARALFGEGQARSAVAANSGGAIR